MPFGILNITATGKEICLWSLQLMKKDEMLNELVNST